MTASTATVDDLLTASGAPSQAGTVEVATPSLSVVARGLGWTVLGRVAGQSVWYGSLLVLAILVSPGAFGVIAVGSVMVSTIGLLVESGAPGSIIITPQVTAAYLRRSVVRVGAAGVGLSALVALAAGPITHLFARGGDPDVLRVLMVAVALASLAVAPLALLKKTLHFKRQAMVMVTAAVVASATSIIAGSLGAGVWALVTRLVVFQACITALAWVAVLDLLPRRVAAVVPVPRRAPTAPWFFIVALSTLVALGFDNLIVGHFTNAKQLGLYAMAFSLGYAPTTEASWQLGMVLFPAIAATRRPEQVATRALKSLRLMGLLLLPLLPVTIAVSPVLIPGVLGHKWAGAVTPFQILVVVGVLHGVMNMLAEAMAAGGGVAVRARIDSVWAALTVGALIAGAEIGGITGAAVAQLVMVSLLGMGYLRWGLRPIGISAQQVVRGLSGIGCAVAVQGAVTFGMLTALTAAVGRNAAAPIAALAGVLALGLVLLRVAPGVLAEAGQVVAATVRRTGG